MRVKLQRHQSIERASWLSRAETTFTLTITADFSDTELAIIDYKRLTLLPFYKPPFHPMWKVPEEGWDAEITVALLLHGSELILGYYSNEHDCEMGELEVRKRLQELKDRLETRPALDEFEL